MPKKGNFHVKTLPLRESFIYQYYYFLDNKIKSKLNQLVPIRMDAISRPQRVPEGTHYSVVKITTRTLLEKFYYSAE